MFNNLEHFYNSDLWKRARLQAIEDRLSDDGFTYCEHCKKVIVNGWEIIAHHIKPLTMNNVNDYAVSLNPENIALLCGTCHNEVHARFGYTAQRKVYLVTGAPCSGKTTYVHNNKGNSDLVVDMDAIWQCITGGELYSKPNALKSIAFTVRDSILDTVKTRAGKWERCWIIAGLPNKGERERMAETYGAEIIHIGTDRDTCLSRLYADDKRRNVVDEWARYIRDYFDLYQE